MIAVGEIGLDYHYRDDNKEVQKKAFCEQMAIAEKYHLPVIIHSREATADTLEILRKFPANGVIHCFSYGKEMAREFLNMGFYIGVGGVVTFKNAKKLKEVVEYTPMDRILLETDCPYLAPTPYRGKRNEPINVGVILQKICEVKGLDYNESCSITTRNVLRLFDK